MIRGSTATFTTIAMLVGIILFRLKYEVLALENTHLQIQRSIEETKESIHVLRAEWAHLTDPARIQKLSVKYLGDTGKEPALEKVVQKKTLKDAEKIEKPAQTENLLEKDSLDHFLEASIKQEKDITAKNVSFLKKDEKKK
ncbi:MAG: hypothetical protein HEEMFOPI_00538 [Holosporales bacterium]